MLPFTAELAKGNVGQRPGARLSAMRHGGASHTFAEFELSVTDH
jgi:hypothetical protein